MPLPWETDHEAPAPGPTHPAALSERELLDACTFGQGRSGGPGGQNRNKVETTVFLVHKPTGIGAKAGERRYMGQNKSLALFRLRLALATEHRVGVPRGHAGSALWRSRVRQRTRRGEGIDAVLNTPAGATIRVNPSHKDYPSLLAEAMDVLEDSGWDAAKAATRLGVSTSQLVKLVKDHPPAFGVLNAARAAQGKRTLR